MSSKSAHFFNLINVRFIIVHQQYSNYLSRLNKPTFDSKPELAREKKPLALDYSEVEENTDKIVEIKNLFAFMAGASFFKCLLFAHLE